MDRLRFTTLAAVRACVKQSPKPVNNPARQLQAQHRSLAGSTSRRPLSQLAPVLPHAHAHPFLRTACFHSTPRRRDVLFVSVPAFKSLLLTLTRVTLVTLPFIYRWKLSKRFPTAFKRLLSIPVSQLESLPNAILSVRRSSPLS